MKVQASHPGAEKSGYDSPPLPFASSARSQGMKSLREDGMRWVKQGETSLEEVLRVSRE